MSKVAAAILGLIAGYIVGAALGGMAIMAFSSNVHDKSVEMVMTAAFFTGPIGAVVGLLLGLFRPRRPG